MMLWCTESFVIPSNPINDCPTCFSLSNTSIFVPGQHVRHASERRFGQQSSMELEIRPYQWVLHEFNLTIGLYEPLTEVA
jgi:hypothetical protein